LIERIHEEAMNTVAREVETCNLERGPIDDVLKSLISSHLVNKELTLFLIHHWRPELLMDPHPDSRWVSIQKSYDQFFLRAQHEGKLRIDISAVALSEIFTGIMLAVVDAERHGRIPRTEMAALMEKMFLSGAKA
jgi:TetR/AcrR family transcriptional repressor of mexCD-oprJ operon